MLGKEILKAASWRNAIKTFDKERLIPQEDFNNLLEIARYSPSSFGLEPWNIIVLKDSVIREEIAPYASGAQRQLASASHFVIFTITTDLEATSEYFKRINTDIKKLDNTAQSTFIDIFGAFQREKQDLTDCRKRIDWAAKQAYIALGNMMLAAALQGIDSCPIEGFIPKEVENILKKRGMLNLQKEHIAVMAAFGYRDKATEYGKARRPLSDIVRTI